ncbi:MAG: type II toxin-antitoxin system Phd/YefM family antitoxin [Candidatus Peribacteraceae bacterium]|jgi:PHD/YefM family antitoxin component YafN of YafNO toxin-antitoxin module
MNKTFTATDARKNFFALLKMAKTPGVYVKIIHEGDKGYVLMSEDEFEGWMETLDIMSDPEEVAAIQEGMREKERGEVVSLEEVHKQLGL